MIVIADDFTGAAEIAGICLGYGLTVALWTDRLEFSDADVLIVSTDTRSMSKADAMITIERITRQITNISPRRVYKKIDSVLRGYVAEDLEMQMDLLGFDKSILLPANPTLDRTVHNGMYYVNGTEIAKTSFAKDPEFPVNSSALKEMLGTADIHYLQKGDQPVAGINTADIRNVGDLRHWAEWTDRACLLAGSGDFFEALLEIQFKKRATNVRPPLHFPYLYVCGTTFSRSRELIEKQAYAYTAFISAEMLGKSEHQEWLKKVASLLKKHQRLIIAFDESVRAADLNASRLRKRMAGLVKQVMENFNIAELLIEGGATASAVFRSLGLKSFEPVYVWQRGVVKMKTERLFVTVKPGSYDLPPEIRSLYQTEEQGSMKMEA